jgi:hypothetical protein
LGSFAAGSDESFGVAAHYKSIRNIIPFIELSLNNLLIDVLPFCRIWRKLAPFPAGLAMKESTKPSRLSMIMQWMQRRFPNATAGGLGCCSPKIMLGIFLDKTVIKVSESSKI